MELEKLPFFETYWGPDVVLGFRVSGFGFRGLWVTGLRFRAVCSRNAGKLTRLTPHSGSSQTSPTTRPLLLLLQAARKQCFRGGRFRV